MTTMWIGPDETLSVGDAGFLVEISHTTDRWERHELRDTPAFTNVSREPQLHGWCGSYNNVATYGRGVWRVIRVAKNGRCLIQELEGDEMQAVLDDLGYPDLTD